MTSCALQTLSRHLRDGFASLPLALLPACSSIDTAPSPSAGGTGPAEGSETAPAEPGPAASGSGGASGTSPGGSGAGGAPDAYAPGDAGGSGGNEAARPGTGPGDWGPGDYPPDIHAQTYLELHGVPGQGPGPRQYKVHVPPTYDPQVPAPLVFCIHGLTQNPVMFCVDGAELHHKSDQEGFILVMPLGHGNSWNAGTCCGAASTERIDDVAFFRALFAEVSGHLNVDLGRVYATGLSNGGFMSYRLACEAADLFTAVAPNAGAVGINSIGGGTNPASDFVACEPSQPVAILHPHGTADTLVPQALQPPSLDLWAARNGCSPSTAPALAPPTGGDTTCTSHDCPPGIEVTGCIVQGGGHCWFGSPDCGTGGGLIGALFVGANSDTLVNNDAIWDFFQRHVR